MMAELAIGGVLAFVLIVGLVWHDHRPARRRRRGCFHHDRPAWAKGEIDSRSYIREELIEMGARKLYVCETSVGGCGRMWFS